MTSRIKLATLVITVSLLGIALGFFVSNAVAGRTAFSLSTSCVDPSGLHGKIPMNVQSRSCSGSQGWALIRSNAEDENVIVCTRTCFSRVMQIQKGVIYENVTPLGGAGTVTTVSYYQAEDVHPDTAHCTDPDDLSTCPSLGTKGAKIGSVVFRVPAKHKPAKH